MRYELHGSDEAKGKDSLLKSQMTGAADLFLLVDVKPLHIRVSEHSH